MKRFNIEKFSKKIVIFCIAFIVLYTISQVILNAKYGIEISPTLTTCVYAFFGTELGACALIKVIDKNLEMKTMRFSKELEKKYSNNNNG